MLGAFAKMTMERDLPGAEKDLAEYGLAEPSLSITAQDTKKNRYPLLVGDKNPAGDACDCAPLDATAWVEPTEVAAVVLMRTANGEIRILWEAQQARFDVAGGSLGTLQADGSTFGAVCLVEDVSSFFVSDPLPDPPAGQRHSFQ